MPNSPELSRRHFLKMAVAAPATLAVSHVFGSVVRSEKGLNCEALTTSQSKMQCFLDSKFNHQQLSPIVENIPLEDKNETRSRYQMRFTTVDNKPASVILRENPQGESMFLAIGIQVIGRRPEDLMKEMNISAAFVKYLHVTPEIESVPWRDFAHPQNNAPIKEKILSKEDGSLESWGAQMTGNGRDIPHGIYYQVSWMSSSSEHAQKGTAFYNPDNDPNR